MYPDDYLKKLYRKYVTSADKVTFIAAIVIGLISHMYMMTNKLPNYDDIKGMINDYGSGFQSGRWALSVLGVFVKRTIGNYSVPWLYGMISITFVAIASVFVIRLLDIRDSMLCFLTGGLMVSFPAITGIMFFMYTAPYYCLAITFSSAALLMYKNGKKPYIFGIGAAVLIAVATGIYQAYLPLCASFGLLVLIKECLDESDSGVIMKDSFRFLGILLGGGVFYFFMVKFSLILMNVQLTEYQGIDKMGYLNISQLPVLIETAYKNYFDLFWGVVTGVNFYPILRYVIIALQIIAFGCIFYLLKKRKRGVFVYLEMIVFLLLFPLTINCIYIIAPYGTVYIIMLYSIVTVYLLNIMVVQVFKDTRGVRKASITFHWLQSILLIIVLASQCQYDNVQYLAMDMEYRQAESYFTTLVTSIKSVKGYKDTFPIVFIGNEITDETFDSLSDFHKYGLGGRSDSLLNIYSRDIFLKRYLGFSANIMIDDGTRSTSQKVENMPCYPDDGSIQVIKDEVIVKLECY